MADSSASQKAPFFDHTNSMKRDLIPRVVKKVVQGKRILFTPEPLDLSPFFVTMMPLAVLDVMLELCSRGSKLCEAAEAFYSWARGRYERVFDLDESNNSEALEKNPHHHRKLFLSDKGLCEYERLLRQKRYQLRAMIEDFKAYISLHQLEPEEFRCKFQNMQVSTEYALWFHSQYLPFLEAATKWTALQVDFSDMLNQIAEKTTTKNIDIRAYTMEYRKDEDGNNVIFIGERVVYGISNGKVEGPLTAWSFVGKPLWDWWEAEPAIGAPAGTVPAVGVRALVEEEFTASGRPVRKKKRA